MINKTTVPAILLGVVMIAGAFAFMPVQEASTVHTSAAGATTQLSKVTAALVTGAAIDFSGDARTTTLTCPNGCIVEAIKVTIGSSGGSEELNVDLDTITVDGQTVAHEVFDPAANTAITEVDMFASSNPVHNITDGDGEVDYLVADTTVTITWIEVAVFDDAADTLTVDFYIETTPDGTAASAITE